MGILWSITLFRLELLFFYTGHPLDALYQCIKFHQVSISWGFLSYAQDKFQKYNSANGNNYNNMSLNSAKTKCMILTTPYKHRV